MPQYTIPVPTKQTFDTFHKYADDTLYLDYDWSTVIGNIAPVTIASLAVTVGAGITLDNTPAIDGENLSRVVLTGGTDGATYTVLDRDWET